MTESILVLYAAEESGAGPLRTCAPQADALADAVADAPQAAVLAIGGDAFCPPTQWRAWVRELPRHRPGIGEAVRRRLHDQGHPSAALIAVDGAVEGGCLVVVAPDDALVRDAALGVLADVSGASRLSVPVLERPTVELESAEVEVVADEPPLRRVGTVGLAAGAPESASAPEERQGPWKAALDALGWTLDDTRWGDLPDLLGRFAPVRQVVESAGERRVARASDGRERLVCGFPDLRRADAKVLSVGVGQNIDGDDVLEILALHRHPSPTGTCTTLGAWTPAADLLSRPVCEQRAGRATDEGGDLFAVEGRTVYLQRGKRVIAWDGNREVVQGSPSQALATLALRWSQR